MPASGTFRTSRARRVMSVSWGTADLVQKRADLSVYLGRSEVIGPNIFPHTIGIAPMSSKLNPVKLRPNPKSVPVAYVAAIEMTASSYLPELILPASKIACRLIHSNDCSNDSLR